MNLTKKLKKTGTKIETEKNVRIWKKFPTGSLKYGTVLEPETWIEIEINLVK